MGRHRRHHVAALLLGATIASGGNASAQDFMPAACAVLFAQDSPDHFDNAAHRAWYRRFWNGSCAGVTDFCAGGQPNWGTEISALVDRAAPDQRQAVSAQACRLGRKVGLEWARDNAVRKINTTELSALLRTLHAPGQPQTLLAIVEQRVTNLLN
jgi:hypothetical protein